MLSVVLEFWEKTLWAAPQKGFPRSLTHGEAGATAMANPDRNSQILLKRKIQIYNELYRFTSSHCTDCERSGCACKDTICAHVELINLKRGVKIERTNHELRFIGCKGCVVPPHLRETCTLYLCEKSQKRADFDRARYEKLIRISAQIEWRLMERGVC